MRVCAVVLLCVLFVTAGAAVSGLTPNAESARCLANLRQLSLAFEKYASEHDGRMPLAADRSVRPWKWWYQSLFPYVEDMRWFYCPAHVPEEFDARNISPLLPAVWNLKYLSYGLNLNVDLLQREGKPVLWKDISGSKILLADSTQSFMRGMPDGWAKEAAARHEGMAHFVTFDGAAFPLAPPVSKPTTPYPLSSSSWKLP